jgi:hypothetical protein
MSKLQEMYEGWKNFLIPDEEMKPVIEKISKARLNICNTCEYDSLNVLNKEQSLRFDRHCTHCGCTLAAKTRSLISSCPIDKWKAEAKQ